MNKFHPVALLATWFCSGLSPKAPGTMGTIAAMPFAYVIHMWLGIEALLVASVIAFVVGVAVSNIYMVRNGLSHDPKQIVIDEVAGLWLTISAMPIWYIMPDYPHVWQLYAAAFVAFRFFDILKPWPISVADRKIGGGFGVMFDDIAAALFAIIVIGAVGHLV